jgi:hypothetical protein
VAANLCASYLLDVQCTRVAGVTYVTGETGVTTPVWDHSRRHARHAMTCENFLISGIGELALLHPSAGKLGRAGLGHRSKPLMRRQIEGEGRCRRGRRRGVAHPRPRSEVPYTLVFWRENQGVGLAFVSQRGYGRRRWLVLYQSRHKKMMTAMRRRKPWPFPS